MTQPLLPLLRAHAHASHTHTNRNMSLQTHTSFLLTYRVLPVLHTQFSPTQTLLSFFFYTSGHTQTQYTTQ